LEGEGGKLPIYRLIKGGRKNSWVKEEEWGGLWESFPFKSFQGGFGGFPKKSGKRGTTIQGRRNFPGKLRGGGGWV